MSDYDYQSYEKSLEKVLESTQKDYWAQYIDINRHQVIVGRTYLTRLGAYSAPFRPPIPEQIGHPFRLIPATYSGAFRPL
jgi:hypothetical protein